MKVKVLFFANLRERIGTGAELVEIPDSASTVAGLRLHLMRRGGAWADVLGDMKVVRVAVNQDMAAANAPLSPPFSRGGMISSSNSCPVATHARNSSATCSSCTAFRAGASAGWYWTRHLTTCSAGQLRSSTAGSTSRSCSASAA